MLNFCHNFAMENEFDFNASKCKAMVFDFPTSRLKKIKFFLGDDMLEIVKSYKYLGVEFSRSVEARNRRRP